MMDLSRQRNVTLAGVKVGCLGVRTTLGTVSWPIAPANSFMVGAKSVRFGGLAKSSQGLGAGEVELV